MGGPGDGGEVGTGGQVVQIVDSVSAEWAWSLHWAVVAVRTGRVTLGIAPPMPTAFLRDWHLDQVIAALERL